MNPKELRVYNNVISLLVDNWPTPLVKLETECIDGKEVWAKLEFYNPFSQSIKDRTVWSMLSEELKKGNVKDVLIEASSGNVGIALTCLANIFGLKSIIFIPKSTSKRIENLLKFIGAKVVRTNYESITREFWSEVKEYANKIDALNLNQFENDANFKIHYEVTAIEIIQQLEAIGRKPNYIFAGIGTSGHLAGIAKRLKERYGDNVKIIGVQPSKGSIIPGIKRIETGQKWLNYVKIDEVIDISWREAIEGVQEVVKREGLLVGLSSGAVYMAYRKRCVYENSCRGVIVLIFPDDGFKYIDHFEKFVEELGE